MKASDLIDRIIAEITTAAALPPVTAPFKCKRKKKSKKCPKRKKSEFPFETFLPEVWGKDLSAKERFIVSRSGSRSKEVLAKIRAHKKKK